MEKLILAISKGRILEEALPLLARAGLEPAEDPRASRRLILPVPQRGTEIVVIRAQDVPTFVDYGAADLGIVGKDVLMEYGGEGLYEPLDLGIARCRMMVAGRADERSSPLRPRVATKYVETTRRHFARQGMQVETIRLYGSMELAPLVGLADRIVDLVDTGNTLRANGLVPLELVAEVSARLIVNKASMKMKHTPVNALIERLAAVLGEPGAGAAGTARSSRARRRGGGTGAA